MRVKNGSPINGNYIPEMPLEKKNLVENVNKNVEDVLLSEAQKWHLEVDSLEFAKKLDEEDELKNYRKLFHYPKKKTLPHVDESLLNDEEEEAIYFCGNSLGLPLKSVENYFHQVYKNWAEKGVHSHFYGNFPVAFCDLPLKEKMAYVVGAEPEEVAIMNGLTVNIHILMSSFYKPTPNRHKVLMSGHGFPSDLFAIQSQVRLHGYDPVESIIFLNPKEGEETLNMKDVVSLIEAEGENIAVILLEGVHYYTGQKIDMKRITEVGHKQGCIVGFDLAHAVGNIKLQLHNWNVDFAMWCTYKYMNSGAGSLSGIFVHNRFTKNGISNNFPMLRGWWGVNPGKKFEMEREFSPAEGADRFKLSNPSPFLAIMVLANLEVFYEVGIDALVKKQRLLTGYLEYLLRKSFPSTDKTGSEIPHISLITPSNPTQRGCQLSLMSSMPLSAIEEELKRRGVVCDIRQPSVMRVTPVPLYNTFTEVFNFVRILKEVFTFFSYRKIKDEEHEKNSTETSRMCT